MNAGLRRRGLGALLLTLLLSAATPSESPVADAAQRGDLEAVRSLLRSGADANAAQGDGMTALHWAAMGGDVEMIDVLLYAGANPEATTRLGGYTPLHLASKSGETEAIDRLLENGADLSLMTATGITALHFAAASGRADAVHALVAHGAEVDARTRADGQTPLMWATAYDRAPAVAELLKDGADVGLSTDVVDYAARAALDGPARRLRQQLVEAKRAAEAPSPDEAQPAPGPARGAPAPRPAAAKEPPTAKEPPAAKESPAAKEEAAAKQPLAAGEPRPEQPADSTAAAETTGSKAEPTAPDSVAEASGPPPRGAAAKPDEKAEEEVKDENRSLSYNELVGKEGGFTALHFASRDGHVGIARMLLDAGADIDQGSGDGTTPLLMAAINGNFDLAMLYLERGADPNKVGEDGAAPLFAVLNRRWGPKADYPQPQAFMQQQTDYLDLMKALLDAGADVNHRTGHHIWYTSFNFDQLGVQFAGATAFWRAAYATDVPAMRLLVSYGADPSIPTRKLAASRRFGGFRPGGGGDSDKSGLLPVPDGGPGVYPIHAASGVGYGEGFAANAHSHAPDSWLPAVRYLVEELGADVNAPDLNGYSPVHHAAARGDNELILYLVEHGADVTTVSRRGETTVDMANGPRQRVQPFPETIALLEGLGAINNHNCQSC